MKEVLLGVARVRTKITFGPGLQLRSLHPFTIVLTKDPLNPYINLKRAPLPAREQERTIGNLLPYSVKLHQGQSCRGEIGLRLDCLKIDFS